MTLDYKTDFVIIKKLYDTLKNKKIFLSKRYSKANETKKLHSF